MTDHRQLIKDCLKGNAVAQKQLYSLFAEPMLGICYRYTKSITDAEDVMQEGFIKVFLHLHQYKVKESLEDGSGGSWLLQPLTT